MSINPDPHVKEYLENLREEDVETLKSTVELFKSIKTWCRITRWLFLSVLTGTVLIWQFYNALKEFFHFK